MSYETMKLTAGVLATLAIYSVLFKENKVYRFFEHLFLGLATGYTLVTAWKETLYENWWLLMFGKPAETGGAELQAGNPLWAFMLPIAAMGYLIFSPRHNWMSRIPIGLILGMWGGQQVSVWWNTWGPQIYGSMQPIVPTTFDSITRPVPFTIQNGERIPLDPAAAAQLAANIYPTQALNNLIFVVTVVSAFSYFLFSFELKGKFLTGINTLGRWLLMIGFGAIFGSTVMARFALVIDRLAYIWIEWLGSFAAR